MVGRVSTTGLYKNGSEKECLVSNVYNLGTMSAYGTGGGMRALPGDYYSTSRFVRAAYLNAHYPQQEGEDANKIRLFRSLQGVAMVEGASIMKTGNTERTIYTSGYSAESGALFHSTYEEPAISCWRLAEFDLQAKELISIG